MSSNAIVPHNYSILKLLTAVLIFQCLSTDALSPQRPVLGIASSRGANLHSYSALSFHPVASNENQNHRRTVELSATNYVGNNKKLGRFYELISVEDAENMLQKERHMHEEEIKKLKDLMEVQRKQIFEFSHPQLPPADVDMGFVDSDDDIDEIEIESESELVDDFNFDDIIEDDDYKQQHQHSHSAAERRTIEIELRQVDEENEELENEINKKRQSHKNDMDKFQGMLYDMRDRSDCIRQELKLELTHFESAKTEMEELVNREQSRRKELEQRLLLERREQEILEEAAIEAQKRHQEFEEQENQRMSSLEEEDRHREQFHRDREEELLRLEQQELEDLERHQEEFEEAYWNFFNRNNVDRIFNNNNASDQSQEDVVGMDGNEQEQQQYQYSAESARSSSPQSSHFTQYDTMQPQTVTASVTAQTTVPPQAKRTSRKNSEAHGLFMNFNDILT